MADLMPRCCDNSLLDKYGFAAEVREAWWEAVFTKPDTVLAGREMDVMLAEMSWRDVLRMLDDFQQEDWMAAIRATTDYFGDLFHTQRYSVVQGDTSGTDLSFWQMYDAEIFEVVESEFRVADAARLRATKAPVDVIATVGHEVWHAGQSEAGLAWLRRNGGKFEPARWPVQSERAAFYALNMGTYIYVSDGEAAYRQQLLEAEAYALSKKIDQRISQCLTDACCKGELETRCAIRYLKFGWHEGA